MASLELHQSGQQQAEVTAHMGIRGLGIAASRPHHNPFNILALPRNSSFMFNQLVTKTNFRQFHARLLKEEKEMPSVHYYEKSKLSTDPGESQKAQQSTIQNQEKCRESKGPATRMRLQLRAIRALRRWNRFFR